MKSTNADFHTCFLTVNLCSKPRNENINQTFIFQESINFFLVFVDPPLRRIWSSKASYFSKEQQLLPSSKGKAVYTCVVLYEMVFYNVI